LQPFGEEACALVEELRPAIVSFHFGLPAPDFLRRVKAAGCEIIMDIKDEDYSGRDFTCRDLEGHVHVMFDD